MHLPIHGCAPDSHRYHMCCSAGASFFCAASGSPGVSAVAHHASSYRLDLRNERLYRGSTCLHLTRKPLRVLQLLVSNPERLITKKQILEEVWPDLHVTEGMVKEYIHDLRLLLEDDPSSPRFIETVRGRGYRYLGGIELVGVTEGSLSGAPGEPSVAVLPFTNLSADKRDDRRCAVLTAGVTRDLSRFRELSVISQHSACRFRLGRLTPADIGRRLGVHYLVTGSIRSAGQRVCVAVELIESISQRVLWSERLVVHRKELVDLQHNASGSIAARFGVLIEADLFRRQPSGLEDPGGLILRAQALLRRFTSQANAEALKLLQIAREATPNNGRVYRNLARAHTYSWLYGWSTNPKRARAAGLECARKAVQCDPLDARAFAELAVAFLHRRQMNEALAEFERATSLNPNDPDILAEYSDALKYVGKGRDALSLIQKAIRLNPNYPDWYLWYMADAYDSLGEPTKVLSTTEKMRDSTEAGRLVAANLAHLGMIKEARKKADELLRVHPNFRVGDWRRRQPWANSETAERFFDGLRRAGLPE